MVQPMGAQLADLRSQIAKEACTTLCIVAEEAGQSFEKLAERFVEILGKVLGSATKVINDCMNDAMFKLLESCMTWRSIPKILDLGQSKSAGLRTKAAGFLEFTLKTYPIEVFESAKVDLIPPIEKSIKKIISDAAGDARAHGRGCFVEFEKMWPDRAARLYNELD
jgi:hypothetical protein